MRRRRVEIATEFLPPSLSGVFQPPDQYALDFFAASAFHGFTGYRQLDVYDASGTRCSRSISLADSQTPFDE